MNIERAIIEKSYAKLKEATDYLSDNKQNDYDCALDELYNAAIARQSVKSEEACEYCDGKEKPLANNHSGYALEIKGSELSVWDDLQCLEIFKINYCPNCGRRLEETT